ncbi:helix-turn-helix domain-containing protein [Actinopolymorpha singaporensis]|uniref:DNA binding domain-containing protein, excisionase family n=1 Tax=Actinopolymorpha singaporensis TaxID=117157 RepID=A0A1H1Q4F6_9ACTN|nr:helix-turn-helix domain-containing protein [Actinopolymorpha singaporensis]SDS18305.1 DNA binding domain-containing protein, excisionase family [Actinopolymorpha singaporensis]
MEGKDHKVTVPVTFLLTAEETAQALRISRTSVYELIKTGQLDSVRIGRRRRISVAAIERYVAGLANSIPAA